MQAEQQDKRPLYKMFRSVPPSYDILNRILTLRLDQFWRKKVARICLETGPYRILDICCGTGDLALQFCRIAPSGVDISALDYSKPMLDLAEKKAERKKLDSINFIHGDVASLPFSDDFFNSIGIAFAFRNLTFHNPDSEKFLSEILRVLKSGGRFVIIETSQPPNRILRKLFHIYMKAIVTPVGGIISGHYGAYKYLSHSACNYYDREELEALLLGAGFSSVRSELLMGGIAAITTCEK